MVTTTSPGVAHGPQGKSPIRWPRLVPSIAIVLLALLIAGCSLIGEFPGGTQSVQTRGSQPPPTSLGTGESPTTTTKDGVELAIQLQSAAVTSGGSVTADVTLRNLRSTSLVYGVQWCGAPAALSVALPMPLQPAGKTWSDVPGQLKQFAFEQGTGPGGGPATAPRDTSADQGCSPGDDGDEATLAPGAAVERTVTWRAQIVAGVPALPGSVSFSLSALVDPTGAPPSYPPNYKGPLASWAKSYTEIALSGSLTIEASGPPLISEGQALDSLLADKPFETWLATQPASTWDIVNVFLEDGSGGGTILPHGPSWEIDVFRERGVARNFALGFVDPFSGQLRSVNYCNAPCDR